MVGHAHKIVPFIAYSSLRAKGVNRGPDGKALLFADLYHHGTARSVFVTNAAGFASLVGGLAAGSASVIATGGLLLAVTGAAATVNLVVGPRRAARPATVAVTLTRSAA